MQKDIHFYLTYALSRKIGISDSDAEKIAWANQYTDDLTEADLHGIQTQSDIVGNWGDRQVQLSVLVPFHFIPGNDEAHPWMTTRSSPRAQRLTEVALVSRDLFQFGISLHGLQDTFSHEGFSGWQEDLNSCFDWYYIKSALPNVGHAELRVIPDVVNYIWKDPRDGRRIDNKRRTMSAAKATYDLLCKFYNFNIDPLIWQELERELKEIFKVEIYDDRKDKLRMLSGNHTIRYKDINGRLQSAHKFDFVKAASNHLSVAMRLFVDLPWGSK